MSELKNLCKGTIGFIVIGILILFGLRFAASEMNAGSEGFHLSLPFLIAQASMIIVAYVLWYCKVNRIAADMMSIAEMRKMAFHYIGRYLILSLLVTGVIAVAAVICMLLNLLFVGIPAGYCYCSVFTMFFLGNVTLYVLMRFLALPNRVTGSY